MNKKELLLGILIVVLAVTCRFIPHLPNFVPITAIALFAGRYFKSYLAIFVPLAAMFLSDLFLGFSDVTFYVYLSFILIVLIGTAIKKHHNFGYILGGTIASSILFFLITNFGVWIAGWYGHTLNGLFKCYYMALPFFRNSLLGDLFYTGIMFSVYEFIKSFLISKKSVNNKILNS